MIPKAFLIGLGLIAPLIPLAEASYVPCEIPPGNPDLVPSDVEGHVCFVTGGVTFLVFETAQCALTGRSDFCLLP